MTRFLALLAARVFRVLGAACPPPRNLRMILMLTLMLAASASVSGQTWSTLSGKLYVNPSSNPMVGIGTNSPVVRLHLRRTSPSSGTNEMIHLENGWNSSGLNQPAIVFRNGHTGSNAVYWSLAGRVSGEHYFDLRVNSASQPVEKVVLRITEDGKAGLGTLDFSDPGYTFFLKGGLKTGQVKTTAALLADYVFADDYALPSLPEVEAFVQQHRHLPGVVSQAEVDAEGGVELTAFTVQLQEKLEELYLHTIALEKRVQAMEAENAALRQTQDSSTEH